MLQAWQQGEFELVVSRALLAELEGAFTYPKLRKRIKAEEARSVIQWLAGSARVAEDPSEPPPARSPDSGDDYLIALAQEEGAALVSGDEHLLQLAGKIPVFSPTQFLDLL